MRTTSFVTTVALIALVGCSSTKAPEPAAPAAVVTPAPAVPQASRPAPHAPPAPPAQAAQTSAGSVTVYPLDDPKSALANRSVYFDFDSALLRDVDRPLIEAHANTWRQAALPRCVSRATATSVADANTTLRWASGAPKRCSNHCN